MRVWLAALIGLLVFADLPVITFGEPDCPGIIVKILDIMNSTGSVACALFESPVSFPSEFLHSQRMSWLQD